MVKSDDSRECFDRTKLAMSLRRSISKRPIDAEQINALLSDTLRRIESEFDDELPSRAIAGSVSSPEETMQLQSTLSFMRENDGNERMTVQSFEHCIDEVVRFHFPNKRNLRHVHWNARHHLVDPLWVHASVLKFVRSTRDAMNGLLLVSGLRESLKGGRKRWTSKCEQEYLENRQFIETLVMRNAHKGQDLSVLFF